MRSHCVVVGAGISGLAAAWHLSNQYPSVRVSVLESSDRVGGKIAADAITVSAAHHGASPPSDPALREVTGLWQVDTGAESVLARRAEAVQLIHEVGLGEDIVHPRAGTAFIWSRGSLCPMPARTLLGIPSDPAAMEHLLTPAEMARLTNESIPEQRRLADEGPPAGPAAPSAEDDISIGDLVAQRLGEAVVDRLVEPLLGGVYAGHARAISAAAALPAAYAAHRAGTSLLAAAAATLPAPQEPAAPVFAGVRGGLHRLPAVLTDRLRDRGVDVRAGVTVRDIQREGAGFRLLCGPVPDPYSVQADMVVLATPPAATRRLLHHVAPEAAQAVATIEMASMAVVTLAVPAAALEAVSGSGVLVPPVENLRVKAVTFSAHKWDWVAQTGMSRGGTGRDLALLRASIGRHGETEVLRRTDEALVGVVVADLQTMGLALPDPVGWHVRRWGGALPQYALGHRATVAQIAHAVGRVPGLAVCGAAYEGVGLPACIASGRAAAIRVAERQ